jgi:hypothetical protein
VITGVGGEKCWGSVQSVAYGAATGLGKKREGSEDGGNGGDETASRERTDIQKVGGRGLAKSIKRGLVKDNQAGTVGCDTTLHSG